MKAIMLSIQPKWCELIASGKKTIEVRKTAPKLETPFTCYIYETQSTKGVHGFTILGRYRLGKVIGEFVCDRIEKYNTSWLYGEDRLKYLTCLDDSEIMDYMDGDPYRWFYAWHISDLKIYDTPKEPGEFYVKANCVYEGTGYCQRICADNCKYRNGEFYHKITRPPQSWCYVEGLNG